MSTPLHLVLLVSFVSFITCDTPRQAVVANPGTNTGYTLGTANSDGIGKFYYGREIAHVMGAAGADWLERSERQEEENTSLAIDSMRLTAASVVADIGAGSGYYAFRIARKVPNGKVYAVEIQDEMISLLRDNRKKFGMENVEIIKGSATSPNLPENSIDLAFMVDVYHELEFPSEVLRAIHKSLKPGGRLLLLEYRGEDASVPIKPLHKTTVKQLNKELGANGFSLAHKGDFLPIQHFLLYEKRHLPEDGTPKASRPALRN